jgi:arginine decarboxylase
MGNARLMIHIVAGTGEGVTKLDAFDSALFDAGIANFNLIRLSSIIPPYAHILEADVDLKNDIQEYGNFLYIVYADMRVDKPGDFAWAGLGWTQVIGMGKRGLFVEHEGSTKNDVVDLIHKSLYGMTSRRNEQYGSVSHRTIGIQCKEKPVCAVVAATFTRERKNA